MPSILLGITLMLAGVSALGWVAVNQLALGGLLLVTGLVWFLIGVGAGLPGNNSR